MAATPDNVFYHGQHLDLAVTSNDTKWCDQRAHSWVHALAYGGHVISDSQRVPNHLKGLTGAKNKHLRALHLRARSLKVNFLCNWGHDLRGWNQAVDLLCKVAPKY